MSTSRNALGRGIGALIPGARSPAPPGPALYEPRTDPERPREIAIADIDPNPDQPRRAFEPAALDALAESIRVHGVLQPVVVRRAGDRYELVVGERRWRASKQAGLASIPAVVLEIDPRDRLEVALVENVQRRDLNPIELAVAFRALADTGATQEEIGQRVGMDRSSIANHLRLLDLSREIQADVEAGRVTIGHAKALLAVTSPERRRHLRDRIIEEQLSVRAAEGFARPVPRGASSSDRVRARQDPHLEAIADALRERLQTRVRVKGTAERGRFEIEYFGGEDFDRITGVLLRDG
jgi:ParB family transcriptional regulator, chromosome partitioning protein